MELGNNVTQQALIDEQGEQTQLPESSSYYSAATNQQHSSFSGALNLDASNALGIESDEEPQENSATLNISSVDLHTITEPATPGSDDADAANEEGHSTPQQPCSSMRFESFESAYEHYKGYALSKGFGIRIQYTRKTKDGHPSRAMVVCSKGGKPRNQKEDTQNPQSIVKKRRRSRTLRTECPAHMYLRRQGAWWHVAQFDDNHNHQLIKNPVHTKFLNSHRHIPKEEQKWIELMHECNIPTSRQMQLVARLYRSPLDVTYTTKDVANLRASFRLEHRHTDIQDTLAYFQELKDKDSDFYWKIKLDEDYRVEYMFWIDGASRRAYPRYNDCLSFDTTYLTNMYRMPCAPFIGINNHGQSIQFGCGFVRNEVTDSFVWLFRTFLEAMGGVEPLNIITDQDFAMRNGIEEVFPNTTHRNCRWHIMKKAQEKLGKLMADEEELHADFKDCVDNSLTVAELEEKWEAMIQKHDVSDNPHLMHLWENRTCWVPTYYMHKFYPFLQTTQRSEGFNAVLKKYVNPQNSLIEFVQQYSSIQDKILNAENKEEADTIAKEPDLWGYNPIEKQIRRAYTQNMFWRFQQELRETTSYYCEQGQGNKYNAISLRGRVGKYGDRTYEVEANKNDGIYSCQCCKFERDGMLCCHVLRVMTQIAVFEIPERYILKRWTSDAETDLVDPNVQVQEPTITRNMPEEAKRTMRYATLHTAFRKVAREACLSEDGNRIAVTHMRAMKSELDSLKRSQKKKEENAKKAGLAAEGSASPTSNPVPCRAGEGSEASNTKRIRDPPRSKAKGRPHEKRFESPMDIAKPKKVRRCSFCSSTGHDVRKCLAKLEAEK